MTHSTAIVVFTNRASRERKRFGLGVRADARLRAFLVDRAVATARSCSDIADVIVADDRSQRGGSFEERLLNVLDDVRRRGYQRVVLIGSDTVSLSKDDLRRAVSSPSTVVGPSTDGGFYLLGIDARRLDVLRGLPWQTSRVGAELVRRLSDFVELVRRADLDGAADARKLLDVLRAAFRAFTSEELDNSRDAEPVPTSHAAPKTNDTRNPERPRGPPVLLG